MSELRAGSCIKELFFLLIREFLGSGFGEEVLSSYLGSPSEVYQTRFDTVEAACKDQGPSSRDRMWPVQDVYTRGRFRLAVCMICFLHVYGVLKRPKESQQRIVLVKSMLCKSVPNRGPWDV